MHNRFIFNILIFSTLFTITGCSLNARIKKADCKYAIGEYYEAGEMYRQIYRRIPSKDKALRATIAFKQAETQRILNNARAAAAYKNAIKYHYPDSIVYLRYAQVLQYQGKYKEAIKQYDIYLEEHPNDYVATAGKYGCMQVEQWKKQPSRYKIALAKEFNEKRTSNFAPAFMTEDGDALVFTSNRQEKTTSKQKKIRTSPVTGASTFNLYSTRKNAAGEWEDIMLCEGLYAESEGGDEEGGTQAKTSSAELGVCCFSADGKTMYFTYSCPINGQDLGAKIYTSTRASGEWGEGQELKLFADSSITVGHPALSVHGDTLYFVSDAPGGYGGKDIYMAILDGSEWTDIHNLGPQINTTDDELFPCVRPDGRLYFSSKGHPGYGGLDLFYAVRRDSVWDLFNMGAPFNSTNDDFGITFVGQTENGFFSSNRGQKHGYDQIYSFTLPEMEFIVEGTIIDSDGEHITDATIRLVGDDGTNVKAQVRRDGTYRLKLNKDTRYVMLATARGYLNQKQQVSTIGLTDSHSYQQDFTLALISKPIKMSNIFYEFGKWTLTQESEKGLNDLVKMLNDNPNITIELSAHTDMIGNSDANQQLALHRAQSVVEYLIQHGIKADRLTAVGYGEDKPIIVDDNLHKQYTFLPKDQVLNEAFITTLSPDKQEICNSLNRRTEFRVLKTTYNLY
ncbi:MAG: OmpA family protein [Paludibacteraceae bacterium]|nr:OmpA family protein [Paludibacteraceae bacterium]